MDMRRPARVLARVDRAERKRTIGTGEHFSPVLKIRIGWTIVAILRVIVPPASTSLPNLDDDLVQRSIVHVQHQALDDDLLAIGHRGLLIESSQVGIEVLLLVDVRDGIKGAFGGRGCRRSPRESALAESNGKATCDRGLA